MSSMIKQMVILGSGLPLSMAAAILANALKPFNIKITALAMPEHLPASEIEICGPEFTALCGILGMDERDIIRHCQGTFRLGSHFVNRQQDWFVPFAHLGFNPEQDDFEQGLFQHLHNTSKFNLDNWSIAASAALAGKFAIAGKDRADLRKALDYGVQLERHKYQSWIKKCAEQSNVSWVDLPEAAINVQRNDEGNIEKIWVVDQQFDADFYLDISVSGSLSVDTPKQQQTNILPITHQCEWSTSQITLDKPYTDMEKLPAGWLKTSYLRKQTIFQFFVCQSGFELAQVEQQLRDLNIGFEQANWQAVNCLIEQQPWRGNCLSLGNASLKLAGLAFSELQLLQAAVVQFVDLFPDLPVGEHNRRHYNQLWQQFARDAADFSVAHFIQSNSALGLIPGTLHQRVNVFERLGRLTPMDSDALTDSQWYHLLYGLGYRPQLPSVVLSAVNSQHLQQGVEKVQNSISRLVAGMPGHQQYLERFYPQVEQP